MKKISLTNIYKILLATGTALLILIMNSCEKDPIIWSRALIRGAYLQMLGPTEVTIVWKTSFKTESVVKYGLSENELDQVITLNNSVEDHAVKISRLKPSTKYYYSIGSIEKTLQIGTNNYFITAPKAGTIKDTRIWVSGDAGSGTPEENMVRDSYLQYAGSNHTDLWLWLGDNAYESGTDKEYQNHVFENHFEEILKNTCVFPTIGNHDFANKGYQSYESRTHNFPYYNIFKLPSNGELGGVPSGTKHYYSFNYNNIHFVSLDSYASYNDKSSPMYNWLKNDLSANTQKWTIVYFHHPPYTKGSHNSDTEIELIDMRQNIVPLLEQYKVDLVLSGHSHVYERSFLLKGHFGDESSLSSDMIIDSRKGKYPNPYVKIGPNYYGTVYVVAGASGKEGSSAPGWPHNAMAYSNNFDNGSVAIDVDENFITARFINIGGNILDEFSIYKN